jgi:citrate synthase
LTYSQYRLNNRDADAHQDAPVIDDPDLLTAAAASDLLGVKRATLYTYASRGLLEKVPAPSGRGSVYRRADVLRLKARHDARSGHGAVAANALRWGDPVVDSSITSIDDGELRYRGLDAAALARSGASFESVVELLWTGELPEGVVRWEARGLSVLPVDFGAVLPPGTPPLGALALVLPALAVRDPGRLAAPESTELHRARRLLLRIAALSGLGIDVSRCGPALARGTVARAALHTLGGTDSMVAVDAIDVALILCADHELNASTFAARVAASTGADLYACLSAALATFSGPRHGGACERVEALVDEAGSPERAPGVLRSRALRGDSVPGFGHPLYPDGDPRVAPMLEAALPFGGARLETLLALVEAMASLGHPPPTLEFGLVALRSALGLPRGSAEALFALGRSAGWVAHALEQRRAGFVLRPRARYVGPA